MRSEKQGASHPSEQRPLAGDPGREQASKGARKLRFDALAVCAMEAQA
jgi:hypothetical protein